MRIYILNHIMHEHCTNCTSYENLTTFEVYDIDPYDYCTLLRYGSDQCATDSSHVKLQPNGGVAVGVPTVKCTLCNKCLHQLEDDLLK